MARERRRSIEGQFAPRTIEMLESPPHRVLSLSGRRVLDRLETELAHHGEGSELSSIKLLAKKLGDLPCIELHGLFFAAPQIPGLFVAGASCAPPSEKRLDAAEVVPFPYIHRRVFIERQALRAAELNPDAGERHVKNQVQVQIDAMRRRGIGEELIL